MVYKIETEYLARCPFCGGGAELRVSDNPFGCDGYSARVYCLECKCSGAVHQTGKTLGFSGASIKSVTLEEAKRDAVESWNRREQDIRAKRNLGETGMMEILSEEHNIVSISSEFLPENKRECAGIYYLNSRDMIIVFGLGEDTEMVGEMIVDYTKLSPKGRQKVEDSVLSDGNETVIRMNEALKEIARIRSGRKGQAEVMRLEDIKIYSCFAAHPPKPEKMQRKERYFEETGLLQSQIILDSRGNLIDGYTSYLLARTHGIQCVPIRYGKRQIVRASHKPGGKLYTWELPGLLIDLVSAGDKAIVRTESGVRAVTVAAVEEYAGNEPKPLKMVIRVKRKGGTA